MPSTGSRRSCKATAVPPSGCDTSTIPRRRAGLDTGGAGSPAGHPAHGRRRAAARRAHADRCQHRRAEADERGAPRAERRAGNQRSPGRGLLHEGGHPVSERDVHRRRAHGRTRLGRGGQRQRLRHGAGDGVGAHLQHAGRADRADNPLCALEQRRDGPERARGVRRTAPGTAGEGGPRRDRAVIPNLDGSG